MRNFFILLKTQLVNFLTPGGKQKGKKPKKSTKHLMAGICVLVVGILLLASYFYSKTFADILVIEASIYHLPIVMISIVCLINFMFSFYSASSVLFSPKDYDLLAAMPIKKSAIVLSKSAVMYLISLVFTLAFSLPSLLVVSEYGGVLNIDYVIKILLAVIFSPLLIMALSIVISSTVNIAVSGRKHKNLYHTIAMLAVFVALFAMGFLLGEEGESVLSLSKIYFLMPILTKSISSWGYLLLFIGINVVAILMIILVVIRFFGDINTLLKRSYRNKNFTLKNLGALSQRKTLLRREMKRFFSLPMLIINSLLGGIISLLITIIFAIICVKAGNDPILKEVFALILPAILIFSHMGTVNTTSAISLEGKSFWIIKSAPISEKEIINSKLFVNLLINVIPAVISSVLLCIFIAPNVLYCFIFISFTIFASILGGNLGLIFNLRFPKMNWENINQVIKQGAPVLLEMLVAFSLMAICFVICFVVEDYILMQTILAVIAGIILVLSIASYFLLIKYGSKAIKKID